MWPDSTLEVLFALIGIKVLESFQFSHPIEMHCIESRLCGSGLVQLVTTNALASFIRTLCVEIPLRLCLVNLKSFKINVHKMLGNFRASTAYKGESFG